MSGKKDLPETPHEWRDTSPMGEALREQYRNILNEPVPEKLLRLIEALKEKERRELDEKDGD